MGGGGWICTLHTFPLAKPDAKLFTKDLLSNLKCLFKRHKTYIRRDVFTLTIVPLHGLLGIMQVFFLPFYLVHELTHALAMWLELSVPWIIMLPMVTEYPFFILGFVGTKFYATFVWLWIFLMLFGLMGISCLNGDFLSWRSWRKMEDILELSCLFGR